MKKLFVFLPAFLLLFCVNKMQAQLVVNANSVTNVTCNGLCDGSAQAVANNGTPPYTYSITAPGNINVNTGVVTSLCTGSYTITVTDAVSNIATSSFVITQPPTLTGMLGAISQPTCVPGCDGTANVIAVGGAGGYQYSVIPGGVVMMNGMVSNLCAGVTYTIVTADGNACTASTTVTLSTPPAPILSVTNIVNANCGLPNGGAQLTATGGNSPYVFLISPVGGNINAVTGAITNLYSGTYTVTVLDANNCSGTSILNISGASLFLNPSVTHVSCTGTCDGSIVPSVIGGAPPITYTITGNNYNALCVSSYTLTATDNNGCTSDTVINIIQDPNINGIVPSAIAGTGSITANPTGGQAPYTYSLNGGPYGANNSFTMLCTGTYTITVKDNNNCMKDATVTVTITAANFPSGNITPFIVHPACPLTQDGLINLAVTPANTYTYQWSNGANAALNNNLGVDTYSVKITNPNNECVEASYTLTALGANCGNITGTVYYDSNMNCVQEVNEIGLPNTMLVANPGNHITFTDNNGNYTYNGLGYNTYTITHQNNLNEFKNYCGNNAVTTLSNVNQNQVINFGDTTVSIYDYSVYMNPACFVVANPNKVRQISYWHNTISAFNHTATVYMIFDSINHFVSSNPAPTSIVGDTVFWNVNDVNWMFHNITVYFNFPVAYTAANTFPTQVGIKNTQFTDINPVNNIQNYVVPFCNAYDPNDKHVSPKGEGVTGLIDINDITTKLLTYTINFQNTGNAPAYNIVIEDTLSDKLDLATFKVLNTSHPYQLEVINNQIIKWKFYNIMLPDSNANEPASHGRIIYQILQKNTNVIGDVINNTAYIYFDYNPAIITSQTVNTLFEPNSITETEEQANQIIIYPNPASDVVYIDAEKSFSEIIIFDAQMKVIDKISTGNTKSKMIRTGQYNNGIYFIKTNNGQVRKLIIQK